MHQLDPMKKMGSHGRWYVILPVDWLVGLSFFTPFFRYIKPLPIPTHECIRLWLLCCLWAYLIYKLISEL